MEGGTEGLTYVIKYFFIDRNKKNFYLFLGGGANFKGKYQLKPSLLREHVIKNCIINAKP